MTAKKENEAATGQEASTAVHQDALIRDRRSLLRSAVTAAPMILTLQSGAALARSSNLISAASPANAKDLNGNTLCMDTTFASSIDGGTVYDLGETPYASVTAIPDRTYTVEPDGDSSSIVTASEMCEQGGLYFDGDKQLSVQQGMLVSATALTSFIGRGARIDISNL